MVGDYLGLRKTSLGYARAQLEHDPPVFNTRLCLRNRASLLNEEGVVAFLPSSLSPSYTALVNVPSLSVLPPPTTREM